MPTEMITSGAEMRKGVSSVKATDRVSGAAGITPLMLRQIAGEFSEQSIFNARSYMHRAATFESRKQGLSNGVGIMRNTNEAMTDIQQFLEEGDELLVASRKAKTQEDIAAYELQFNELLDKIDSRIESIEKNGVNLLKGEDHYVDLELGNGVVTVERVHGHNLTTEGLEINRVKEGEWYFKNTKSIDRKSIETARKSLNAAAMKVVKAQAHFQESIETAITYQDFTGGMVNIAKNVGRERALLKMESKDISQLLGETKLMLKQTSGGLLSKTAVAVIKRM